MESLYTKANDIALKNMQEAEPFWTDVKYAHEVIKGMDKYTMLHSGPPINFKNMCEPMKAAVIAALLYEGIAIDEQSAMTIAESNKIKFYPCNDFNAVTPITSVISYSMPLLVIKNETHGNYAYCTINEGKGNVARLGFFNETAVNGLKWIKNTLAPALRKYILLYGNINLKSIITQALYMGDELHISNIASSKILISIMADGLIDVIHNKDDFREVLGFISDNEKFFLNFAMAAAKSIADAAANIEGSTIVTTIARNGVETGIKVSGMGDNWYMAQSSKVKGTYILNYKEEDASLDIGDSSILETVGLGAFSLATAPMAGKFIGQEKLSSSIEVTKEMQQITWEESKDYKIANLDLVGIPMGIDIIKVIKTGILPKVTTAIVGKDKEIGLIGAGISEIPKEVFEKALAAYKEKYKLF